MIYTKDNLKLVNCFCCFQDKKTFTGVAKDKENDIAYYLNGKFHRENGPAIEYSDGGKSWYLNGIICGFDDDYTNESWIRFTKLLLLK